MALQDRYEILGPLGEGGMSRVLRARDRNLNREVAIKIPRAEILKDQDTAERFRREARAAASLTHPNIVRIYDYVDDPQEPYLVMELIEGEDLRHLLDRVGSLEVGAALTYARQILGALAYAHDQGVIHRDLSARNVLLEGSSGAARVSDFGIARALGDHTLTPNDQMIGSVGYMSPEQARGDEVGPACDLYSAGCLLYEMVTGRLPFAGDNPVAVALKHVEEDPVPPDRIRPDLPSSLVTAILKAMAKSPADRFASAREMEQALAHVPRATDMEPTRMRSSLRNSGEFQRPEEFRRPKPGEGSPPQPRPMPTTATVAMTAPARTRRWVPAAIGLGALILVSLVILLMRPGRVEVPNLAGLPQDEARTQIMRLGLTVKVESTQGPGRPGTVTGQVPGPGSLLAKGDQVVIHVVAVPDTVEVPDFRGLTLERAKAELSRLRLTLRTVQKEDENVPEGVVMEQAPAPGTRVTLETPIELVVSKRMAEVSIPELVGLSADEARNELRKLKMDLLITSYRFDATADEETVLEQSPSAGARAKPGGRVRVVLSRGNQGMNVPQLEGKTVEEARRIAEGMGLKLTVEGGGSNGDTITMQEPPAGDPVKGSEIMVRTAQTTVVPSVQGLGQQEAQARIQGAGLRVGRVSTVWSESGGFVMSQEPLPGIEVAPGTAVHLTVGDPNAQPPEPQATPTPPGAETPVPLLTPAEMPTVVPPPP